MSKPTKKLKKPRVPRLPDPNVTAFRFVQRLTGQPAKKPKGKGMGRKANTAD